MPSSFSRRRAAAGDERGLPCIGQATEQTACRSETGEAAGFLGNSQLRRRFRSRPHESLAHSDRELRNIVVESLEGRFTSERSGSPAEVVELQLPKVNDREGRTGRRVQRVDETGEEWHAPDLRPAVALSATPVGSSRRSRLFTPLWPVVAGSLLAAAFASRGVRIADTTDHREAT